MNLKLLKLIRDYKPGGIVGLYKNLSPSIKARLELEAMRKAIRRDFKDLDSLADNLPKLHQWLSKRKNSANLQMRIVPDNFLLNNTLLLLGVSFEALFDENTFPDIADEARIETETEDEDIQNTVQLLSRMNLKLDELIYAVDAKRLRRNYVERYFELMNYLWFFSSIFLPSCNNPETLGFSQALDNDKNTRNRDSKEIYAYNLYWIQHFSENINKKKTLYKLFIKSLSKQYTNFEIGRLFCALLMVGILIYFCRSFISSALYGKKRLFNQIMKGKIEIADVNESFKKCDRRTIDLIKHILESPVLPDNLLCIEYEKVFVRFFHDTNELFSKVQENWINVTTIVKAFSEKSKIDSEITNLSKGGITFSFNISCDSLKYLDNYLFDLDELQDKLERYYEGNETGTIEERPSAP